MQAFKADIFAWMNKYTLYEFICAELTWSISSLTNRSRASQMERESVRARICVRTCGSPGYCLSSRACRKAAAHKVG